MQNPKPCCSYTEQKPWPEQVVEGREAGLAVLAILQDITALASSVAWGSEGNFWPEERRGANELCNHPWGRQDPPGPHYLCLVEFKLPSPASAINPSPALRYFPMKASLKKKSQLRFLGMSTCQTEGSQPHCVNNNELTRLEKEILITLLTPSNSKSVTASGGKNTSVFAWKGFFNSTWSVQEHSQTAWCNSVQNYTPQKFCKILEAAWLL